MRIVILGGYGTVAQAVVPLLAPLLPADYVIAGRRIAEAERMAKQWSARYRDSLFSAASVDCADTDSLRAVCRKADLVMLAASTLAHTATVARVVLDAGADYLDVLLSAKSKLAALRALEPEIRDSGRCFVTDGGFHPGLPGALVRFAASRIGPVETADVACYLHIDWHTETLSKSSVHEFAGEIAHTDLSVLQDGKWVQTGWSGGGKIDFGGATGVRDCVPMALDEMRVLPEHVPGIRNARFLIAGLHPLIDYVVFPAVAAGEHLGFQEPVEHLLRWALHRISKPPFLAVVVADARNEQRHLRMRVCHADAYLLTAAPLAWTVLQWSERKHAPGLWHQAHFVDPARLLRFLEGCGIGVDVDISEAASGPRASLHTPW